MSTPTEPHEVPAAQTLATAGLPRRVHRVLEKALTLVSDELERGLSAALVEFEQHLFRLADRANNPNAESGYMQTLRTLRLNRADLVPRFMLALEAGLASLRSPAVFNAGAHGSNPFPSFRNLSLVEDTVMDEGAVLHEIASRQESRSSLSLHLLGQRFGVLAGAPAFDAERIPLGPQSLCRAMRDASQNLQVEHDARLLLYRIFDRRVMAQYPQLVETLDAMFANEGILPSLTYVPIRTRASAMNEAADGADPEDTVPGRPGTAPGRPATSGSGAGDRGSRPAQRHPSDPNRPHTAWMGQPGTDVEGVDEEAAFGMLQQLLSGRRELIHKLRPARPGQSESQLSTRDVDSALGAMQAAPMSPSGAPRTLSDIKQTLLAQARQQRGVAATLSQNDNDTFELLGLLYGQIESEVRPDAPATALIKRLLLPMLRVALQDRAFFVRPHHPARQLLNTVSETAAKWLHEDDFDPQLLAPLQHAVSHVVKHFDGDTTVFDTSNQLLQGHIDTQVRKAEMLERRHVEAARGKEKLEVAKRRAVETMTSIVGDQRLPKFSRALLNQAWADVLTLTLLRQGEDSEEWRRQLDVTRQIVTACSHGEQAGGKPASTDPALAPHIETALGQVGYHADEAAAIAQRLTSSKADDEEDPASRTELTMKLKARTRLGEDAAKARKPDLPPRTPEEQARYEQLRVMPFGAWIEFVTNQQGDVVRRRLSWFSPITDNALFVNQRGQRVGEQSLDSLARMITHGQARIVTAERGRLVDRAWQAALNALRSFAGRGDAGTLAEATP